jgi:hypothetical protein
MVNKPKDIPFLNPVLDKTQDDGIAITKYEIKNAEVTRSDWKLLRLKASLKNAIKTEFTQVTNPKTKNNTPMINKGPFEFFEVVVMSFF